MRLFTYYVLHTFKNQLKKLFKTWVLIFLVVCMVLGGVIGLLAGVISDSMDSEPESGLVGEEYAAETDEAEDWEEFEEVSLFDVVGITENDLIELIAGGVILAVLLFMAFSADQNGSKIFMPADVNLLFASPMKPQSVLMFRLTTKLGMSIVGSLYLLFQIPNLVLNLGLSIWAALVIIAAWCFTIVLATLIQVLLYLVSATYPRAKPFIRKGIFALLGLIVLGFVLTLQSGPNKGPAALAAFFNGRLSRLIPVWGWLKGFCMYAIEGNLSGTLLCLAGILLAGAVLIWVIHHIKADFYEDAMAKSQELAELLEAAQSEKSSGILIKRKKDRSEKLRRDGLHHGWGANVFFFKTMYNRFRFAHLGFLTKTMEFYLAAALIVGAFFRFTDAPSSAVPIALVLAGLTFFRSLGNPLEQDTGIDSFRLIPESTWAKLFWSLMGGSANCLLDVLLPLIAGALLVGANPLAALIWLPFIVSVDFYATNVGAFIGFSTPASAGKVLKQVVQVLFVYFGLVPDIAVIAVGMMLGAWQIAVVLAAVLNIGLGLIFFALSPLFLDPHASR